METNSEMRTRGYTRRTKHFFHMAWLVTQFSFTQSMNALARDLRIIRRELDLFFGAGLFLLGLLGFESGRYCDGNIGDHLSCTRPATFYYFDGLDIALIVFGVVFILIWYFKSKERNR